MKLHRSGSLLSREERNKINENWSAIEDDYNNVVEVVSDKAFDKVVDSAKLIWKEPVNTYDDLPDDAEQGETRMVRKNIDGVAKVYRFNNGTWEYVQDIDVTAINEVDKRLSSTLDSSRDIFFSSFDYQELLAESVTTIAEGDSKRYPQGGVIDSVNNRYYIARQTTGKFNDQMLFEYELGTNKLIRKKPIPTSEWVYIEGLVFFFEGNDICFIIPTSRYGDFGIFNFDTGELTNEFTLDGTFKIGFDNDNKYFLCAKSSVRSADDVDGINLYDFESVKMGSPSLVHTVEFLHEEMFTPKMQGITMIDDIILLGRGQTDVVISALDINGNTLYNTSHNRTDFLNLIGGNPFGANTNIESEGISWVKRGRKTYPVLFNCTQGKAVFVQLGDANRGSKLRRAIYSGINPIRYLKDSAPMRVTDYDGNPTIYASTSDDFYKIVESIDKKGLYTFFLNGSAANSTPDRRSMRGTIIVSHLTNGLANMAEIRGQDFAGNLWSNYYDINIAGKWTGWRKAAFDAEKYLTDIIDAKTGTVELKDSINSYKYVIIGTGKVGDKSLTHAVARGWYNFGFRVGTDYINIPTNDGRLIADIVSDKEINIIQADNSLRYVIGVN